MGKSQKPLTLLVHAGLSLPEVATLQEKGHIVTFSTILKDYDLVLGPNCFRMTPALLKYLPLALKGARAIKYPPKPKKEKK